MKFLPVPLAGIVLVTLSFTNTMLGDVVVFSSDFDSGIPAEITGGSVAEGVQGYAGLGPAGNQFGGLFLRNEQVGVEVKRATLSLSDLPSHTGIEIDFLLAIIDSWDGSATGMTGDEFIVTVDGATIFSHVFENSGSGTQSYMPPAGVELARKQDLGFTPPASWYFDSAYNMGLDPIFDNIAHTSDTLTIVWSTKDTLGWSGFDDESWAIDNLTITLTGTGVPEPGTVGLMSLVAMGLSLTRRRRRISTNCQ